MICGSIFYCLLIVQLVTNKTSAYLDDIILCICGHEQKLKYFLNRVPHRLMSVVWSQQNQLRGTWLEDDFHAFGYQ